jgi:hypothetical protein
MSTAGTVARARWVLFEFIVLLSSVNAFWYVINPVDYACGFSLCSRLGLDAQDFEALLVSANLATIDASGTYKILPRQWQQFVEGYFSKHNYMPKFTDVKIDLDAYTHGKQSARPRRRSHYILRIGKVRTNQFVAKDLTEQVDDDGKLLQMPPRIHNIYAKHRDFFRAIDPIILEARCSNTQLYDKFMATDDKFLEPDVVVHKDNCNNPNEPKKHLSMEIVSPQPTKKPRTGEASTLSTADPDPSIPTPSPHQATDVPTMNASTCDPKQYPILSILDNMDRRTQEQLFIELTRVLKDGPRDRVVYAKDDRNRMQEQCWINVPVNDSEKSFKRQSKDWFGEALSHNGKKVGLDESSRRACDYLALHHKDSVTESLQGKGFPLFDTMSETRVAAMWQDANVSGSQEETILKHLRSHFGSKAFTTRKRVRMLSEGHSKVFVGKVQHSYEPGEAPETIEYSYKDKVATDSCNSSYLYLC